MNLYVIRTEHNHHSQPIFATDMELVSFIWDNAKFEKRSIGYL